MQPHKPEPPIHSVSTTHQARWVGELTGETRHSSTHAHNKIDLHNDTSTLPAKEKNNDKDTTCCLPSSHGRQGHSLPQGHPPPITSKLHLQPNSVLSIVMSTSSRDIDKKILNETCSMTINTTCTLNPQYTMAVPYF